MKILIACEYSGTVREAFAAKGHTVWSCDILPTEIPGNHYQGDVFDILDRGWDMLIAFPPCTYLSYVSIKHWNRPGRKEQREAAMAFFLGLANAPIEKIAVENPVGWANTIWRKPDQIVHPYYFGEPFQKRTCLWLKNLPPLDYFKTMIPKPPPLYICQGPKSKGKAINWVEGIKGVENRSKARSKTFQGIANAMATAWSDPKEYQTALFA